MYDNFKIANYSNTLLSPELYARPMSRLFKGEVIDGFTVIPGAGLQVVLNPGNGFVRYGSTDVASARIVSLVADFALTIPTPDASNPRIDSVVLYVDMAETLPVVDADNPPTAANLDGPGVAKSIIVSGTPAAVPVAPTETAIQTAVGAGNPYIVLGNVTVDQGVSVIAAGKITDVRNFAKVGSSNIDFTTSIDANGWKLIDHGSYKEYLLTHAWSGSQSLVANGVFAFPVIPLPAGKTRADLIVDAWPTTNNRVFLVNERSVTPDQTNVALEANNWHTSTFGLTNMTVQLRAIDA